MVSCHLTGPASKRTCNQPDSKVIQVFPLEPRKELFFEPMLKPALTSGDVPCTSDLLYRSDLFALAL